MEPIKMTRAEYQAKYGSAPVVQSTQQPVKMTRAEYQAKYGVAPVAQPTGMEKTAGVFDTIFGGGKLGEAIGTGIAKANVPLSKVDYSKLSPRAIEKLKSTGVPTTAEGQRVETQGQITSPTGKEVAGSILQSGALFTPVGRIAGTVGKALPKASKLVGASTAGATAGYGYDVGSKLSEGQAIQEALKPGGATLAGALLPPVAKVTGKAVSSLLPAKVDTSKITGTIVQGTTKDISKAQSALKGIDTSKIKTYKDLTDTLDTTIQNKAVLLDSKLLKNQTKTKLNNLALSQKVDGSTVKHNFVQDAVEQLKSHYVATNDVVKLRKIEQLEAKARKDGLLVKELNDLAREHGSSINAFNANGQAASGLSKQAAENTRMGLKTTARNIFANKEYELADKELANLIRTRDLTNSVAEKVNQLQQRVTERGLGERAGRLVFQVIDKMTGGGAKGFVQSFIPRGEGLKIMNALDLEKNLNKNLNKLQEALNSKTESEFVLKLERFLRTSQSSEQPLKKEPTMKIKNSIPKKLISPTIPQSAQKSKLPPKPASLRKK